MNSGLVPGPRGLPSPPRSPIRPLLVSTCARHSLPRHPATSTGSSCAVPPARATSPRPLLRFRDARAFFPSTHAGLRCSKLHLCSGEAATQDLFVTVHRPPPSRPLPALPPPLSRMARVPILSFALCGTWPFLPFRSRPVSAGCKWNTEKTRRRKRTHHHNLVPPGAVVSNKGSAEEGAVRAGRSLAAGAGRAVFHQGPSGFPAICQ